MTIASGIANYIVSLRLVTRFGLLGMALGRLIPTTVVCLGLVTPYAMRVMRANVREMSAKVLLPTLCPVIPMAIILVALREAPSFLLIVIVGALGQSSP